MPRYDDRHGNTRLYVGHLSSRTRTRDLERLFSRYGRVRDVDMKRDYAFIEFSDPRDADDARYHLDGRDVDGSRLIVEFSRGVPRGSREYGGRDPPPGSGRCFNCGVDGHWARDCTAGDWKNRCYRCGDRGHIERDCKNSPKKLRRGGSYSRSPVRSRSPRHRRSRTRSRSRSYSQGRSYSRSRSPVKRERSVDSERSRSPVAMDKSPPPKGKDRSASLEVRSPRRGGDRGRDSNPPSPNGGSDYSGSPRENGGRNSPSPAGGRKNPAENDGHGHGTSPTLRDDKSPVDNDYEDKARSARGSESP